MFSNFRFRGHGLKKRIPVLRDWEYFKITWEPVCGFWKWLWFQIFPHFRNNHYFPYDKLSTVVGNGILVGKNSKMTQRGGCYIQGTGKLFVGDYVNITQNCIITSSNHSIFNHDEYIKKETIIGDQCWIASNVCINAGVVLGPRTIVGAGSIVTKSFPDGYCLIAGNPAKLIKTFSKEDFTPRKYPVEFYGYIRADRFPAYKKKHLGHIKFHYDLTKVTSNEELIRDSIITAEEQ